MPPFVPLRRSTRDHHPSTRYSANEYVLLTDGESPSVMQKLWKMKTKRNGKRALKNKWVYKLKTEEHTSRPRCKARLVVKGFSQKRGIDFDEIFSPVVKMGSIRVVLGLAASLDLEWSKWMSRQLFFMNFPIEARFEQVFCYEILGADKTDPWHSNFPR
uniref:Retrovirus-related Pol polyprotein from transposon TNT 1-94 n=1 Tax=Tanacetum cinerariifolium TaxID=118510 RepID=A0A699RFY1_TANCI|nr:retrovirus-related Pol polyprotein from transposon TNT 1-94 [Tanacetum cinerariifolium]